MKEITVKKEERCPLMAGLLLLAQSILVVLKAFGYIPLKWIWVMMPLIVSEGGLMLAAILSLFKK